MFSRLETDAVLHLLSMTSPESCCCAARATPVLLRASRSSSLWQHFCNTHFPGAAVNDPRETFVRLYTLSACSWHSVSLERASEAPPALEYAASCAVPGGLLLFGGRHLQSTHDKLWRLDLHSGSWHQPVPADLSGPGARCFNGEHTGMALVAERWVLMHGGLRPEGFRDNETWCLDSHNFEQGWRQLQDDGDPQSADRPRARYHHSLTVVGDKALLVGGHDYRGDLIGECCLLSPAALFADEPRENHWDVRQCAARAWHTVTAMGDGDVLVFGGDQLEPNAAALELWHVGEHQVESASEPDVRGEIPSRRFRHTAVSAV